jgi:hypothetical protein
VGPREVPKLEIRERTPSTLRNVDGRLKWFCDTSTGAATGTARCGSFVRGGFGLLVASY